MRERIQVHLYRLYLVVISWGIREDLQSYSQFQHCKWRNLAWKLQKLYSKTDQPLPDILGQSTLCSTGGHRRWPAWRNHLQGISCDCMHRLCSISLCSYGLSHDHCLGEHRDQWSRIVYSHTIVPCTWSQKWYLGRCRNHRHHWMWRDGSRRSSWLPSLCGARCKRHLHCLDRHASSGRVLACVWTTLVRIRGAVQRTWISWSHSWAETSNMATLHTTRTPCRGSLDCALFEIDWSYLTIVDPHRLSDIWCCRMGDIFQCQMQWCCNHWSIQWGDSPLSCTFLNTLALVSLTCIGNTWDWVWIRWKLAQIISIGARPTKVMGKGSYLCIRR